jgi:SAM-dependent methyltransferase
MTTQAEHWNGPNGDRWTANPEAIDHSLAAITELWLPWVAPRAEDRVLDVGCGCGTTTIMMAERAASARGVDISAPMLGLARRRAPQLDFVLADAATHAFEPVHDLIVSRFGVMFFDDPIAAFANLHAALAPGGRLAFVCWRASEDNAWAAVPLAAANGLVAPAVQDPHAPGPFAFADRHRLEHVLTSAGFRDLAIAPRQSTMWLGETLEEAVAQSLAMGPLARAAAGLDEPTRDLIRARLRSVVTPTMSASIWLVGARA